MRHRSTEMKQGSVAVIFAGEARGDERVWSNIRTNLIVQTRADAFAALWNTPAAECFWRNVAGPHAHLRRSRQLLLVEPLLPRNTSFDNASNEEIALAFGLNPRREDGMLARPQVRRVLPQYYMVRLAFQLVRETAHEVLVRARSDVIFDWPIMLRLAAADAVHVEAGRWEVRAHELAMYGPGTCGSMPNDWFAFGKRAPMASYARMLDAAGEWYPLLRHDPSLKDWRKVWFGAAHGVRPNNSFLNNQEGMLGFYLRWAGVPCALVDAGLRLCRWRAVAGAATLPPGASLAAACAALGTTNRALSHEPDEDQWCSRKLVLNPPGVRLYEFK